MYNNEKLALHTIFHFNYKHNRSLFVNKIEFLKALEHSLRITIEKNNLKYPKQSKQLRDKAYTLGITWKFWKYCAQTRTFSNTTFNMGDNHFLSSFQFLSFKICCHNILKSQIFNITFLYAHSETSNVLWYGVRPSV